MRAFDVLFKKNSITRPRDTNQHYMKERERREGRDRDENTGIHKAEGRY